MIKIGFCGAPSSGKTTVAQQFSSRLRYITNKNVELIDEYARFFVSTFGDTSMADQYHVAHEQIDKEIKASKNTDYLITDSPIVLTTVFTHLNMDWSNPKDIHYFQKTYSLVFDYLHSYDFLFYFPPLQPKDDGRRIHKDKEIITQIDQFLRSIFILYKIDFIELTGTLEKRIENALKIVKSQT